MWDISYLKVLQFLPSTVAMLWIS